MSDKTFFCHSCGRHKPVECMVVRNGRPQCPSCMDNILRNANPDKVIMIVGKRRDRRTLSAYRRAVSKHVQKRYKSGKVGHEVEYIIRNGL